MSPVRVYKKASVVVMRVLLYDLLRGSWKTSLPGSGGGF